MLSVTFDFLFQILEWELVDLLCLRCHLLNACKEWLFFYSLQIVLQTWNLSVVLKVDNNTILFSVRCITSNSESLLHQVQATDFDTGVNKEVRYELHRGNGEVFAVDRSSGDIRLKQTLEGLKSEYELLVSAYDKGKSVFSCVLGVCVLLPFVLIESQVHNAVIWCGI